MWKRDHTNQAASMSVLGQQKSEPEYDVSPVEGGAPEAKTQTPLRFVDVGSAIDLLLSRAAILVSWLILHHVRNLTHTTTQPPKRKPSNTRCVGVASLLLLLAVLPSPYGGVGRNPKGDESQPAAHQCGQHPGAPTRRWP